MADDDSPPGSPLSDLSSDDFDVDVESDRLAAEASMPPAKRQKTAGDSSLRATLTSRNIKMEEGSISSDTDGEIPESPNNIRLDEDDVHEQVTVCAWQGCDAGDVGDMDKLVDHLHHDHIDSRPKRYTCEWKGCIRKSQPQASAYALKAHMRSHTGEKPFYCALPECDRSFTRGDALHKHMRTVHETEALRPSDPAPRFTHDNIRPVPRAAKIVIKPLSESGPAAGAHISPIVDPASLAETYPPELGITAEEEAKGPVELWKLLRRQIHWAEEESESLRKQCEFMENLRHKEWMEKEILLDQVIKSEISWHERRKEALAGLARLPTGDGLQSAFANSALSPSGPDYTPNTAMSLDGGTPAFSPPGDMALQGPPKEEQAEAATVLASLARA